MGHIKEPKGIDFMIKSKPLTNADRKMISEYIKKYKQKIDKKSIVSKKVVGQTSFADCLHIAIATINKADYLISWNFKHIVNIERIEGYNSINLKKGYKQLDIRSPREFEKYEDN